MLAAGRAAPLPSPPPERYDDSLEDAYLCTRHCPVKNSHRIDDVMQDICVESKMELQFDSAMRSKIATQKEAEQTNKAASLNASRATRGGLGANSSLGWEIWSISQLSPWGGRGVENNPDRVVANAE